MELRKYLRAAFGRRNGVKKISKVTFRGRNGVKKMFKELLLEGEMKL